jgi:chemotaxis protein CheZ
MTELMSLRALLEARAPQSAQTPAAQPDVDAFKTELSAVYDAVSRTKQEIAALLVTGFATPEMGRVTNELKAVVGSTESATHSILEAGEEIEELAKTLSAAIKNIQDRDLARDILDQVTRIFEACNFQDLAGQRIGKVSATLKTIEEHIIRLMDIWGGFEKIEDKVPAAQAARERQPKLVNGPKLEGERGHISQKEIDKMFVQGA